MSQFEFTCPHCNVSIQAEDDWVGQEAECPSCGKDINIQRPDTKEARLSGGKKKRLLVFAALGILLAVGGAVTRAKRITRIRDLMLNDAVNLKQIYMELWVYAECNDRCFPDEIAVLWREKYLSERVPNAYLYLGKGRNNKGIGADDVLACTKPGVLPGSRVNVLYGNGKVKAFTSPPQSLRDMLAK